MATLAYYGSLRWPLTIVELSERMIPCGRLGHAGPAETMSVGEIVSAVARLVETGRVRADSGLFTVGDAPGDIVRYRIARDSLSSEKWRAMLGRAWWLQCVPYVRLLSAGGSLAMGSSGPQSDWDVFAVVEAGRLYTARAGLLLVAFCMGRLRTKRMRTAPDRFCFNHIITTDGLAIRHRSLFTAHALSWLVPFYDPHGYAKRLRQANLWISDYVTSTGSDAFIRRTLVRSRLLSVVRRCIEMTLNTFVGSMVERIVRRWMRARVAADPATAARGGRIVADEYELEFHPRSFELVALRRYNAALAQFGMGQYAERDSGLTH